MKPDFIDLSWIKRCNTFIPVSININEISHFSPDTSCSDDEAPIKIYSQSIGSELLSDYPTIITLKSSFEIKVAESYEYIQNLLDNK